MYTINELIPRVSDEARAVWCARKTQPKDISCNMGLTGLILGLRPANERRRYFVTTSLIGWAQT